MINNDRQDDQLLAAIVGLRTYDVSQRHTHRLRSRCHVLLHAQPRRHVLAATVKGTRFRRVIGPALGGAWCLAYLVEIVRRAAGVYGF